MASLCRCRTSALWVKLDIRRSAFFLLEQYYFGLYVVAIAVKVLEVRQPLEVPELADTQQNAPPQQIPAVQDGKDLSYFLQLQIRREQHFWSQGLGSEMGIMSKESPSFAGGR